MHGREKLEKLIELACEEIDKDCGGEASVGAAMIIVEVRPFEGDTSFYTFCSDKRRWIQSAMLKEGVEVVEWASVEEDDDTPS